MSGNNIRRRWWIYPLMNSSLELSNAYFSNRMQKSWKSLTTLCQIGSSLSPWTYSCFCSSAFKFLSLSSLTSFLLWKRGRSKRQVTGQVRSGLRLLAMCSEGQSSSDRIYGYSHNLFNYLYFSLFPWQKNYSSYCPHLALTWPVTCVLDQLLKMFHLSSQKQKHYLPR